jgi:excisionase family DNA binding protein
MEIRDGDTMLSLAQAAARLGLSPITLRAQARKGILRATLIGHSYVVPLSEVDRYAREHMGRVGPKPRRSTRD